MKHAVCKRGVTLVGVLMVLGLLAAVFGVLSTVLISVHQEGRLARLEFAAQNAADSVVGLLRHEPDTWRERLQSGPRAVAIDGLLPSRATGSAELRQEEHDGESQVSVVVTISRGRMTATARRVVRYESEKVSK